MSYIAGICIVAAFALVAWLIDMLREIHRGVWRVVNDVDRIKREMGLE